MPLIDLLLASGFLAKTRNTRRHSQTPDISRFWVPASGQSKKAKDKLLELFNPFSHVAQYVRNLK